GVHRTRAPRYYALSLPDALPISGALGIVSQQRREALRGQRAEAIAAQRVAHRRQHAVHVVESLGRRARQVRLARLSPEAQVGGQDRKSTRLNSSHVKISYAVFCL